MMTRPTHFLVLNRNGTSRLTPLHVQNVPAVPKCPGCVHCRPPALHASGCGCNACREVRERARVDINAFIEPLREQAARAASMDRFLERFPVRPILDGFEGESVLDRR
jgi:hypothetical protein